MLWLITLAALLALPLLAASCGAAKSPFPIRLTAERVNAGRSIYTANCASCHGTPDSPPPLPAAPPHTVEGHTWHHADRDLFNWVLDRPPLATQMPAFRGVLSEDEVIAVLAYIKSTWPREVRDRQTSFSESYERQLEGVSRGQ
ncbi:MAG: cytochrome c [Chloroflexi bacterium]|nr:cytochrome c [Chloroflexota bacterium]